MSVTMVPDDKTAWPSLGGQVCAWIESNLVFGPGDLRGQPAKLDQEKKFLIWRLYEIYPRKHEFAGRRRFKRAAISLPKGLGKTELGAWIAICELHPEAPVRFTGWEKNGTPSYGRGVVDPYIPLVAYTEEQSDELCYGAVKSILESSNVRHEFDIGYERIVRGDGTGKLVSLASSPSAREGARTTFSVMDETHLMTSARLLKAHQTMLNNLPKRLLADTWMLEITTAPEPGSGSVAENTMEYGKSVDKGIAKGEDFFFFHRQASDKYSLALDTPAKYNLSNDAAKHAAVVEASGEAAKWRDVHFIVGRAKDPTTDINTWRRVWLNQVVRATKKAFDVELWKGLQRRSEVKSGDSIAVAFDGSVSGDSTGIVAQHLETGLMWVPGLWECPYGPKGKKWRVPTNEVDQRVRAVFAEYNVVRMYADPAYWQSYVSQWQGAFSEKVVVEWWTNRRLQMSYALQSFEQAIINKTIFHDGNPDLTRHIGNAHRRNIGKDEKENELWLIEKERTDSPFKIDLAMCAVLCNEARNDAIAEGALQVEEPDYKFEWID